MHTDRYGNTRRQKCCAKGSRKELKYKSLCIEIQQMCNLKCTIIPVIIGATGIVTRSLTFGTGILHLNFSTPVCKM
jgi:hypothetical protein